MRTSAQITSEPIRHYGIVNLLSTIGRRTVDVYELQSEDARTGRRTVVSRFYDLDHALEALKFCSTAGAR